MQIECSLIPKHNPRHSPSPEHPEGDNRRQTYFSTHFEQHSFIGEHDLSSRVLFFGVALALGMDNHGLQVLFLHPFIPSYSQAIRTVKTKSTNNVLEASL